MVLPTFSDGEGPLFFTFNSIALLLAGISSLLLSAMLFIKIFPGVAVQKNTPRCEDSTVLGMNPVSTSHIADAREDELKVKIFSIEKDPVSIFHLVRLAEIIGSVADHAENAGDMMRAMIAKQRRTFFRES